jgi:uncharacterized membrane protein YkvA (DUF1232 family)
MKFFKDTMDLFIKIYSDRRLPGKDKKIIIFLLLLILSPLDLLPDWIPLTGLLDDFAYLSILMNYFFKVLDSEVVLSHYPWSMKSFAKLRALGKFIGSFTPKRLSKSLWKYEGRPY